MAATMEEPCPLPPHLGSQGANPQGPESATGDQSSLSKTRMSEQPVAKRARVEAHKSVPHKSSDEWELRCKLAAAYRIASFYGWDQVVFNHITVQVPGSEHMDNGPHFLLNPFGLHFSEVTASSLIRVASDGDVLDAGSSTGLLFKQGFVVHSAVHMARHDAKCVWHCHHEDTTAVSMLKCGLLPLSQEATFFMNGKLSYHPFEGIVTDIAERDRMAKNLGPTNTAMLLENHGPLVLGKSVEEAFLKMFLLTRACTYQVKAMSMVGGDLSRMHVPSGEMLQEMEQRTLQSMKPDKDDVDKKMEKYDNNKVSFGAARRLVEKLHGAAAIYC